MRRTPASPEGELLRRSLLPGADEAPVMAPGELDPDRLVDALRAHQVACTTQPALSRTAGLPADAEEAVRQRRLAMAFGVLGMLADLELLVPLLDEVGGPWVVVKGPAAAVSLYGGLDRREWNDLDVVVDHRAFPRVLDSLEQHGARLVDRNWPLIRERMQAELSVGMPRGTALDLHWHLLNARERRAAFRLDMDAMFAERRRLRIGKHDVPVLSERDQLLHLCLHACLSGGHRLQWLKDIQLAAARTRDWDAVVERAREFGTGLPTAVMLERARDVLGAPVPDEVLDDLHAGRGWRAVARATSRLSPPQDSHLAHRTGKIVFFSTRGSDQASFRQLGRRLLDRRNAAPPLQAVAGVDHNPLHRDAGVEGDRQDYLRQVVSFSG